MRQSRRIQGLPPIMPLTRSPTTSTAAASLNPLPETPGNENETFIFPYIENTTQTQEGQEQVTNNFNKRFEDM